MHARPSPLRGWILATGLLAGILPGVSHATLIAIFSRPGELLPLDQAASWVQALKDNPATLLHDSLTLLTSDSSVLTPEFSVPPGVSAYFWSNETFRHRGFTMKGTHVTFDREPLSPSNLTQLLEFAGISSDSAKPLAVAVPLTGATRFEGATTEPGGLGLRYALSKPGRVSVEIFELNGRSVGRWNFTEPSAGSFRRSVKFRRASNGPHFVRWTAGGVQEVRPLSGF